MLTFNFLAIPSDSRGMSLLWGSASLVVSNLFWETLYDWNESCATFYRRVIIFYFQYDAGC
jgi:hypothetical protein